MTPSNRARLLVLLSAPVAIGASAAIRHLAQADEKLAWVILAEIVFLIVVYVNGHRQAHHLTCRQVLAQVIAVGVALAIVVGGLMIVAWVFDAIRTNWRSVGPILVVVGFCALILAVALLVLYLVVRVVRVAWKGR